MKAIFIAIREWMTSTGVLPLFTQYYQWIIMVTSSLVTDLIMNTKAVSKNTKNVRRAEDGGASKDETKSWLIRILKSSGLYLALLCLNIAVYVGYDTYTWKEFRRYFKTVFVSNIAEQWFALVFIPISVFILSEVIRNKVGSWVKGFVLFILAAFTVTAPLLTIYEPSRSKIEPMLLAHFQEMPYMFVTKMYAPGHYQKFCRDGYGDFEQPGNENDNNRREEKQPPESVDETDFDELVDAATYYIFRDKDMARDYLNKAYEIYQSVKEESLDDFHVGSMWYYMGVLDMVAEYYYNAGEVFERINQRENAIMSYDYAYDLERKPSYAEKALTMEYLSMEGQITQSEINHIASILLKAQESYTSEIPHLDAFLQRFPDNLPIQTVGILRHIADGSIGKSDKDIVRAFLDSDRYRLCPKLLLIDAYYNLLENDAVSASALYNYYQRHSDYFEPEDIINLAWMLNMDGQTTKAYKLAAVGYSSTGISYKVDAALPLLAELYLQIPEMFANVDSRQLVSDISSASEDLSNWYSESDNLRFSIMTLFLANKTGYKVDGMDIASMCRQLFTDDTVEGAMINAQLDYEDGEYQRCRAACDALLEDGRLETKEQHAIRFLKTDALVELAKRETDDELRLELYMEAKDELLIVQSDAEEDYLESLRRLKPIYTELGPDYYDAEKDANEILQIFGD